MAMPTPDELGPLLGETASLDDPAPDVESESGEYDAAAVAAVGTRQKAAALKDAILACLREHGLLDEAPEDISVTDEDTDEDYSLPDEL